MAQKRRSRLQVALDAVVALETRQDVEKVMRFCLSLLEAYEDEESPQPAASVAAGHSSGARGHFEDKLIRGYGPYRYLRWWDGGKHRSHYIGKVKEKT